MSESASGTVGGILTFSRRKSGQQVRYQRKQKDQLSNQRTIVRSAYQAGVSAWKLLSSAEKAQWTRNAKSQNLSGYNLYLSIFLGDNYPVLWAGHYGVRIYGELHYGTI